MVNAIAVRVGKKSDLKFVGCQSYRAISISELKKIVDKKSDCSIIVIEKIASEEQEIAHEFIQSIIGKNTQKLLLFYVPDNDEITSGIADEFDLEICMTAQDVYSYIQNRTGESVSPFIKDRKETVDGRSELCDVSTLSTDTINIENNTTVMGTSVVVNIDKAETEPKEVERREIEVVATVNVAKAEEPKAEEPKAEEPKAEEPKAEEPKAEEPKAEEPKAEEPKAEEPKAEEPKAANITLSNRIDELELLVSQLKEEKSAIQKKYADIISDDHIVEQPIGLSEYQAIQEQNAEYSTTIQHYKDRLAEIEKKLSESDENKTDVDNERNRLNAEIEKITQSLRVEAEYRMSAIEVIQSAIEEIYHQYSIVQDTKRESEELKEENSMLYSELEKLNDECNKQKDKVSADIIEINNLKNECIDKDKALSEASSNLNDSIRRVKELTEKLGEKEVEVGDLTAKYKETLSKLNEQTEENSKLLEEGTARAKEVSDLKVENTKLSKQAELANKYADETSTKLQADLDVVTAKLRIAEDKLAETEKQLNEMVSPAINDISNTNEEDEKIIALKTAIEEIRAEKEEFERKYNESESECRGYKEIIKSISGGDTSGIIGKASVKPINYTGISQIITVCGSGSYGITMTAMSIAEKLSLSSKVLYIDFDLVTASADAYLVKSPFCRGVPGVATDERSTSFGIFLEKGMSVVSAYTDKILIPCTRTKGGGLDYFSGLYYRPDQSKLSSADFSTLLQLMSARYTYIIIDMGRLGNSVINDSLISALSNIAYRNIFITTQDRFDIRNFRLKLTNYNIRVDNSAWLINMCEASNIEQKSAQTIAPIPYGILKFDPELRGKHERFYKTRTNKDALDLFLKSAVFGGK